MVKKVKINSKVNPTDFVPPDGGWGWMIVFAAGFSNVSNKLYSRYLGT